MRTICLSKFFRVSVQTLSISDSKYNGPQNLDSVLSYTWEENEGEPSEEFKEKAHTVI